MYRQKRNSDQIKLPEKRMWHPFMLQGLPSTSFIDVVNKILTGEFGIMLFRHGEKQVHS